MSRRQPKVGFVSLGCPKALVDSERIITRLRAEGYQVAPSYDAADVVVVNTCGFIDSAVDESLDAIGEALEQNGKVIVTGCLGARPERILERHPKVLKVTGPQAYEEVVGAVHEHLPPKHDPFVDLVPPQGIKLTPRHYAYLKISEGCNNKCSFCIIPSMRGLLASRPIDDVLREAERLARLSTAMLTLARAQTNTEPVLMSAVLVGPLLDESVAAVDLHGLQLHISCPDDLRVAANRDLAYHMFCNLLANAAKHGASSVRVEAAQG